MSNIFYMVYLEHGGAPTFKHTILDNAITEAKRLSQQTGRKAYILESIKSVEYTNFIIEDFKQQNDDLPF